MKPRIYKVKTWKTHKDAQKKIIGLMIEACQKILSQTRIGTPKEKANYIIIPDNIAKLIEENEQQIPKHNR